MKKLYFFCTKLQYYIIELPIIFLLVICAKHNNNVSGAFKLYPLMIFLSLAIVFTFVYFFRFVSISFDEVRDIGPFSSRERTVLKKGRSLKLTLLKRHNLKIEINGSNEAPTLDWIDPQDFMCKDVNLFRTRALGGATSVRKLLRYFDIPSSWFEKIFGTEDFISETEKIKVSALTNEEKRSVTLYFKETL